MKTKVADESLTLKMTSTSSFPVREDEEERIVEKPEFVGCSEAEKIVLKILESEILDPVWFQVLRNHPELQVDSDGKQVPLERNHNLRRKISPYQHVPTERCLSSIVSGEEILCCVGMDDTLSAVTSAAGKVLCTTSLRQADQTITDPSSNPPATYALGPSTCFGIQAHRSFSTRPTEAHDDLHLFMRLVLLGLDLFTEYISPESAAAAAKKAAGKKGPPEFVKPKRLVKYRLQVVDLHIGRNRNGAASFQKIHDIHFDAPFAYEDVDIGYALFDYVRLNLDADGCMLSLVVNDSTALCRLYELTPPLDHVQPLPAVDADSSAAPSSSPRAAAPAMDAALPASGMKSPVIVAQWQVANTSGSNVQCVIQQLCFLPAARTTPPSSSSSSSSSSPSSSSPRAGSSPAADSAATTSIGNEFPTFTSLRPSHYPRVRLGLVLTGCPFHIVLRLEDKPEDKAVGKDKPKEAPKSGKGAVEAAPVPPPIPCHVVEGLRWHLSHAITCTAIFRSQEIDYIVIGQQDGLVSLWDLSHNRLVTTLGTHPSAVTALAVYAHPTLHTVQIIAGAANGTLSAYSNFQAGGCVREMQEAAFVDFRQDCYDESVMALHYQPGERGDVVIVQYRSETLAAYSLPELLPLGHLSSSERLEYQDVFTARMTTENLPLRYFVPLPVDEPPPVEVVPDPKAKGAAAPPSKTDEEKARELEEEKRKQEEELRLLEEKRAAPLEITQTTILQGSIHEKILAGNSLQRYHTFACLTPGSRLVLHGYRLGQFVFSWFDLGQVVEQERRQRELDPHSVAKSHPTLPRVSSLDTTSANLVGTSISRKASRAGLKGPKLKDIHELSVKTLKLTEERLEAHQKQLEATQVRPSGYSHSSGHSMSWLPLEGHTALKKMDMLDALKSDLKESKRARDTRKSKFSSTIKTLASLC